MKYNWLSYPWRVMLVSFQFNFSETKTVTVFSLESILAKLTNVNVGNTRICSSGRRFKLTSFPLQIWSVSLVDLQVDAKGRRFSEKDWYYLQAQTDMLFHYLKLVVWIFPLFLLLMSVGLAWKSAAKQKQTKCRDHS